jgi:hypothetical protein
MPQEKKMQKVTRNQKTKNNESNESSLIILTVPLDQIPCQIIKIYVKKYCVKSTTNQI